MKDNTKETPKNAKAVRTERLKPFRFTSANQPANRGRKKGRSATDWLKKLAHTNISFLNPLTGKTEQGEINLVVAIQLILKATQDSDLPSIREYLDRLDGKLSNGPLIDQSTHYHVTYEARVNEEGRIITTRVSSKTG